MMIECRLLHKISMGPIIFIILLPSCPRLLVILMLSVTALCQTLLSPCCLLIAEICLGILVISLKYSFITPAYDLLSLLLKLLLSLPPLTVSLLCLSLSSLLLFELLGKTYQWTQGTLSNTSCQFKTNYPCTKGPKNIQTLC